MRRVFVLTCFWVIGCGGESSDPAEFEKGALTECLVASGNVTTVCVRDYVAAEECRADDLSTGCDTPESILADARARNLETCTDADTFALGYFGGREDFANKSVEACTRFGSAFAEIGSSDVTGSANDARHACQTSVWSTLAELRDSVVRAVGPDCTVLDFDRGACDRTGRDAAIANAASRARDSIVLDCGDDFDSLRLASLGASLEERVQGLVEVVIKRSRNLAIFAYPPNNIGPTAEFGPFPIGIRTYELVDESRQNVSGNAPRPVTFDVYYPTSAAAIDGVPQEIVSVLGIEILPTPSFRDVATSEGIFPLVLFSHGFEGIRFQSFFHVAHLASHGFIVVSPDHHGNTIPDGLAEIVDPATAVNRAFDMKFLMDQILDPTADAGAEFSASIDPERIGMSGHSYGGYEAFILTGGEVSGTALDETTMTLGTFTDPRIKAILPMAPRTMRRVDAVTLGDSYFQTVTVPTMIIGSELDMTDPFFVDAMRAFNNLPTGPQFVGLAEILDGGHNTFTDLCELESGVLDVIGGAAEGCMPRHLPWKHAHDLINYLSLNFFDGVLNGNDEALERLSPEAVGEFEDLRFWRK